MKNELIKLSSTLEQLGYKKHSSIVRGLGIPNVDVMLSKFAERPSETLVSNLNSATAGRVNFNLSYNEQTNLAAAFATNSSEVTQDMKNILDSFADLIDGINLKKAGYETNKIITAVELKVFTDPGGASATNQQLTQSRAEAMVAYLNTKTMSVPEEAQASSVAITARGMGEQEGVTEASRYFTLVITQLEDQPVTVGADAITVLYQDGGATYHFVRAGDYFIVDVLDPDKYSGATEALTTAMTDIQDTSDPPKKVNEQGNALVFFRAAEAISAEAIIVQQTPIGDRYVVQPGNLSGAAASSYYESDVMRAITPARRAAQLGIANQQGTEAGQVARTEAASWSAEDVERMLRELYETSNPLEFDPDGAGPRPPGRAYTAGQVRRHMRYMFKKIMRNDEIFDQVVRQLAQEMTASDRYQMTEDNELNMGLVFVAAMQSRSVHQAGASGAGGRRRQRSTRRRLNRGRARAERRSRRRQRRTPTTDATAALSEIENLHKVSIKKSSAKSAAKKRRDRIKKENMR